MTLKTTRPVALTTDELFDCAAARTLALGATLDEGAFAALVDYVRMQLLAAARIRRGAVS